MILVADVGGTKTDWRLLNDEQIEQFRTPGFNPHTHDQQVFLDNTSEIFASITEQITIIHYYGASVYPDNIEFKTAINTVFPNATVHLNIDLLGSCRSLSANDPGFIGILGTGSAGCFYDGAKVANHPPSLGHALGDEGSGTILGRRLVREALRKRLVPDLQELFDSTFKITKFDVYNEIYGGKSPNTYLATFAKFLGDNRNHPQVHQMLLEEFELFFNAYFSAMPDKQKYQYHFTGSIAMHFSDHLRSVGDKLGLSIGRIVQAPIAGLALYHQAHG